MTQPMIVFCHLLALGKSMSNTLKHGEQQQIYHPFFGLANYKARGLKYSYVKI